MTGDLAFGATFLTLTIGPALLAAWLVTRRLKGWPGAALALAAALLTAWLGAGLAARLFLGGVGGLEGF